MSGENQPPERPHSLVNRLHFLYKVVEDTQATIRFLDTKAAFCVTLLSGMAAVCLGRPHVVTTAYRILLPCFLAVIVFSLLVCLRVIFPTIKPSGRIGKSSVPKFYVGYNKAHHWMIHTIASPVDDVLSENQQSYMASLIGATEHDLLASMCDAALKLALIRQLKSDRLHAAMFCLMVSVFLFAAVVLT